MRVLFAAASLAALVPTTDAFGPASFDFSGSFSGHYPAKTCLDVVSMGEGGNQINATKVTGTDSVPAGKVTFYFDAQTLKGYGRLAQSGFVNPYWAPVTITPAGLDRFDVADDMSRPCVGTSSCTRWGTSTFTRWFEVCKAAGDSLGVDAGNGTRGSEEGSAATASEPRSAAAATSVSSNPATSSTAAFNFIGDFSGHYPSKGCLDVVSLAAASAAMAGGPHLGCTSSCGGAGFPPCGDQCNGADCRTGADCESSSCYQGKCMGPPPAPPPARDRINATKVTGTASVPAGKVSFYFDSTSLIGYGRLAQSGFVNPYWSPVTITPAGLDRFDVADDMSRPCVGTSSCTRWGTSTFTRWFEVCKAAGDSLGVDTGAVVGNAYGSTSPSH